MKKHLKLLIPVLLIALAAGAYLYKHYDDLPVEIPGWEVKAYKNVTVEGNALPLVISSNDIGGIYLYNSEKSEEMSCLQIDGQAIDADATLRLSIDDDSPEYVRAPNNNLELIIPPHKNLELMIYADNPFSYELGNVALTVCPDIMTDEQFKAYLLKQIPGLEGALASQNELAAARLILHWSARVSDLGDNIPKNALIMQVSALSAPQIYQRIWLPDAGGGSCGAFAVFYDKLLKLFNINSFTVDMGLEQVNNFTHVTTIIALPKDNGWAFYLFDPTSDSVFSDEHGNYMDLETLFSHYDKNNKILDQNYWNLEECLPRDRTVYADDGNIKNVEKDKPYCPEKQMIERWERRAKERNSIWAEQFEAYLSNPNANIFVDMLMTKIYHIGPALQPESREAFINFLSTQETTLP